MDTPESPSETESAQVPPAPNHDGSPAFVAYLVVVELATGDIQLQPQAGLRLNPIAECSLFARLTSKIADQMMHDVAASNGAPVPPPPDRPLIEVASAGAPLPKPPGSDFAPRRRMRT